MFGGRAAAGYHQLTGLQLVVLLYNTLQSTDASNDAEQTSADLINGLSKMRLMLPEKLLESALYCCNMKHEEKEFWHPYGADFPTFVLRLLNIKKFKYNFRYSLIEFIDKFAESVRAHDDRIKRNRQRTDAKKRDLIKKGIRKKKQKLRLRNLEYKPKGDVVITKANPVPKTKKKIRKRRKRRVEKVKRKPYKRHKKKKKKKTKAVK